MKSMFFSAGVLFLSVSPLYADYDYQEDTRTCVNENSEAGYNEGVFADCGHVVGLRMNARWITNHSARGGDFPGAGFHSTNMRAVDFESVKMVDSDIISCRVIDADFSYADLSVSDLNGTQFRNVSFHGANLQSADFDGTNLSNVDLTEADLRGSDLNAARFSDVDFKGAKFNNDTHLPFSRSEAEERGMVFVE